MTNVTTTRFFLLLAAPLVALALVACGGDDDDASSDGGDDASTSVAGASVTGEASADGTPTKTPESALPTPTPPAADEPVVSVVYQGSHYSPTAADLESLPQSTISAGGNEYTGVTLSYIAAQVGAPADITVTIEGYRSDGLRYAIVRYPLAEVAEDTLVVFGQNGHLELVSASLPAEEWVTSISAISFP